MKDDDNNVRRLIGFPQFLDLVRDADMYSIAVVPVNQHYEVHAEVGVSEDGIQRLTLENCGQISFSDEQTARRVLTEALTA